MWAAPLAGEEGEYEDEGEYRLASSRADAACARMADLLLSTAPPGGAAAMLFARDEGGMTPLDVAGDCELVKTGMVLERWRCEVTSRPRRRRGLF
jgi:hypothetical protein